jgi:hypothetical protein
VALLDDVLGALDPEVLGRNTEFTQGVEGGLFSFFPTLVLRACLEKASL